jgi:hypothetical protein
MKWKMVFYTTRVIYLCGGGYLLEAAACDRPVWNFEFVYRSVKRDDLSQRPGDKKLRVSSAAFNDRNKRPSVDRAMLRKRPEHSKKSGTDAVYALPVGRIRDMKIEIQGEKQKTKKAYAIDVIPRPIRQVQFGAGIINLAHSQVESAPEFDSDSHFRKLKERLAWLAEEETPVLGPS